MLCNDAQEEHNVRVQPLACHVRGSREQGDETSLRVAVLDNLLHHGVVYGRTDLLDAQLAFGSCHSQRTLGIGVFPPRNLAVWWKDSRLRELRFIVPEAPRVG